MDNSESQYLDSIRIRALTSVMEPDWEAFLQGVFEWYSTTFYTPLYEVMELPVDYILYTYYRGVYKQMEIDERYNEAIFLLETPAERAARKVEDKQADDEFMRRAQEHNAGFKKIPSKVEALLSKMKKRKELQDKPLPEISLPKHSEEEEVTIKYMSDEAFEAELDKPLALPPRKSNANL